MFTPLFDVGLISTHIKRLCIDLEHNTNALFVSTSTSNECTGLINSVLTPPVAPDLLTSAVYPKTQMQVLRSASQYLTGAINHCREDSQAKEPSTVPAGSSALESNALQQISSVVTEITGSEIIHDRCMPDDRKGSRSPV